VEYTVYLKPGFVDATHTDGDKHFVVDKSAGKGVRANVAYYLTSFGSACVTGQIGETALIPQKYSIKFITSDGIEVDAPVIGRSGNPGYLDGLPVLVGVPTGSGSGTTLPEDEVPFAITDADRVDVFPSGFKVRGADDKGLCIDSSSPASSNIESFDYFDPVLEFNQDLVYTCQAAKMDTLTSRECNDFDFSSHLIFTHLE
jgi:hypothetical protein